MVDLGQGTGTVTKTRCTALDGASVHHPGVDFAEAIWSSSARAWTPCGRPWTNRSARA
ncbi:MULTISPECIES: hypothetical protein [Streptomyces]|uniref:hypothetical protein n=1 Tax=Streptomyces TaxID=1883 RepID=UPI0033EB205A